MLKVCFKSFKILIKITIDNVQMLEPHSNCTWIYALRTERCSVAKLYRSVNLSRKRKKVQGICLSKTFSYNMMLFSVKLYCYFYWGTFVYFIDFNLHFVLNVKPGDSYPLVDSVGLKVEVIFFFFFILGVNETIFHTLLYLEIKMVHHIKRIICLPWPIVMCCWH